MTSFHNYGRRLLQALDIEPTEERLRFLHAWQACEGGKATFNPWNTTMHVPGSRRYNEAGVQHYPDAASGLAATLLTLRLPYYSELVHALQADGLSATDITRRSEKALKTWGTGSVCIYARLSSSG